VNENCRHEVRRWAKALSVVTLLALAITGVMLATSPPENGANIGAGLAGLSGMASGFAAVVLWLLVALTRKQGGDK
jgi:UDP-N-acetylmuramyl pentapeptide phosphotransferase/UDP-N-acetylglucosamine-1-phosphate transferase